MSAYDEITRDAADVAALARLLEACGNYHASMLGCSQAILEGMAAVARVIEDKMKTIEGHAQTLCARSAP